MLLLLEDADKVRARGWHSPVGEFNLFFERVVSGLFERRLINLPHPFVGVRSKQRAVFTRPY